MVFVRLWLLDPRGNHRLVYAFSRLIGPLPRSSAWSQWVDGMEIGSLALLGAQDMADLDPGLTDWRYHLYPQ